MDVVEDRESLEKLVNNWKAQGLRIGLVPTMGNLHQGHMALVDAAHNLCDKVITSIFVNPTQFAPDEDFDRYPRTWKSDRALLQAHACDAVFMPQVDAIYPFGLDGATNIHIPGLAEVLDGAARPGHFDGVCTVVMRLFLLSQADHAFFGKKDYQQLKVVTRMVQDLGLPLTIEPVAIERAEDGLALSSRNMYLTPTERRVAPLLYQTLQDVHAQLRQGSAHRQLEKDAQTHLQLAGFKPDYVVIVKRDDLHPSSGYGTQGLIILAAATLGHTRLIDNIEVGQD